MSTLPAIPVKDDFADWLNPMLVKELRQGLKTKAFVIVFVLVQVALVILMGFRLLAQNDPFGYTAGMLDGLLWTAIGGALLVLMPLRALTAISEEDKANTLHLVQLTRLSSTRIVWGKWIALVSQTLLLSVAILPYAVLRYFFGGIDIVSDLLALMWMLGGSLMLTAGCLVLSTLPMGTRVILLAGGVPGTMVFTSIGAGLAVGGVASALSLIALVHSMVMTTLVLLALAASRIAPAAENHALIMRGLALVAAFVALVATWLSEESDDSLWLVLLLPILFIAVLQALVERTSDVPSVYAALAKRGPLSRFAGRALYPGWATGMVFTAFLVAATTLTMHGMSGWLNSIDNNAINALGVVLCLALVTPVLLVRLVSKQRGWIYLLMQAGSLLVWALGEMLDEISSIPDSTIGLIMGLLPTPAYIWGLVNAEDAKIWTPLITGATVGGALFILLLLISRCDFRLIRTMEAQATAPNDKA
jgi:ABC-type transport system involved in multi-copper enzyme maturation permease subunit